MYKRRQEDRRSFAGKTAFPLKTKAGALIEEDRRCLPDRRLGNIHLELIDIDDHCLPDYFSTATSYSSGKKGY